MFIGTQQIVSQVPDSTFGEPYSLYGNLSYSHRKVDLTGAVKSTLRWLYQQDC
jgi:hypothetical protein